MSICAGQSVPLNANGGSNYSWSPSTGLSNAAISNPSANPTATTTYTVTVSSGNCTATDQVTITVNSVAVNAGADLSICEGGSVQLQAASAGNVNYVWTPTNGLSNPFIANPNAAPSSTTIYVVTATDGLCSSSDEVTVTVNSLPATPVISQNGSDLFCGTAASSYQWYLNGVEVNGAINQTFTPSTNGSYAVEVVNASGCSALSEPFNFVSVALSESFISSISVYPNPNTGMFRLSGSIASKGGITIDVVNLLGERIAVVFEGVSNPSLNQDVDISNFANGVYFVRVVSTEGTVLKKVIKN